MADVDLDHSAKDSGAPPRLGALPILPRQKSGPADDDSISVPAENWRSVCTDATSMLAKARQKDLFTDVRFLVGRKDTAQSFSAHKTILACGSPVFAAMFFGNLVEKQDPIPLPDDDPDAFQNVIRFLYGEPVSFPDIIVACKTSSIGDKYLIPQLQKMSESYLSTTKMDDTSFWELLQGNPFSSKIVQDKFFIHIQKNAARLLKTEEFLHASEEIVKTVLQLDQLDITEFELLSFVGKWASKNDMPGGNNSKLQTLLPNIRFSLLTPEEFCRFHGSFPRVLPPATSLEILKHLIVNYRLPRWCSRNTKPRNTFISQFNFQTLDIDNTLTDIKFTFEAPLKENEIKRHTRIKYISRPIKRKGATS